MRFKKLSSEQYREIAQNSGVYEALMKFARDIESEANLISRRIDNPNSPYNGQFQVYIEDIRLSIWDPAYEHISSNMSSFSRHSSHSKALHTYFNKLMDVLDQPETNKFVAVYCDDKPMTVACSVDMG